MLNPVAFRGVTRSCFAASDNSAMERHMTEDIGVLKYRYFRALHSFGLRPCKEQVYWDRPVGGFWIGDV